MVKWYIPKQSLPQEQAAKTNMAFNCRLTGIHSSLVIMHS